MVYSEENYAPCYAGGSFDHDDDEEEEEALYNDNHMDTTETTTLLPTAQHFQLNNIQEDADDGSSSRCKDYIHRIPIRFPPRFLLDDEGHNNDNMGPFLSLPFIFNLALAHHLKFVSMFTTVSTTSANTTDDSTKANTNRSAIKRKVALQKVLRLYELTYALQTELITKEQQQQQQQQQLTNANTTTTSTISTTSIVLCTSTTSEGGIADPGLRFNIIICNNLSQVHMMLQNHEKQKRCLQQLLSMLMYVVDLEHESHGSNSSNSSSSIVHEQAYSQVASLLSSTPPSLTTTMTTSLLSSSHRRQGNRKWLFMDLDGFLQNTSHIILQDNCAMVA